MNITKKVDKAIYMDDKVSPNPKNRDYRWVSHRTNTVKQSNLFPLSNISATLVFKLRFANH